MSHNVTQILLILMSGLTIVFATSCRTWVNSWTQKLSDCSFLGSDFVMICVGGLHIVPAYRLANNCAQFF